MKLRFAVAALLLLGFAAPAFAHRLDEYLQATLFTVERDHIAISMRLTPGVEVFGKVLAAIDTRGDGVVSNAKQQAYAEKVRRDLSLSIDGSPLPLRLVDFTFPTLEEMKQGLGEIVLRFEVPMPPMARGGGSCSRIIICQQFPFIWRIAWCQAIPASA